MSFERKDEFGFCSYRVCTDLKSPNFHIVVASKFFYFVDIALKQSLLSKFWSYFEDIVNLNLIDRSSVLQIDTKAIKAKKNHESCDELKMNCDNGDTRCSRA